MKKKNVIKAFDKRITSGGCSTKRDYVSVIEILADEDEAFENIVFELGCSILAKALVKRDRKEKF